MKRYIAVIFSFIFCSQASFAHHIIGGELRYAYIGPGVAPNSNIYKLTLLLFRGDDPLGAQMPTSVIVGIYNLDNGMKVIGDSPPDNNNWLFPRDNPPDILPVPIIFPSCIGNPPVINFTYAYFSHLVELPSNMNGYSAAFQTCCREDVIVNVPPNIGATYSCIIPGTGTVPSGIDSSPQFGVPLNVICKFSSFILNFSATDPDNDSLVYSFCNAYDGGAAVNSGFNDPAPPPYNSVPYQGGYTGAQPLGNSVVIDSHTGIISGIAPGLGDYVVCVCINVFRNGVWIAQHRKDLIVRVSNCQITQAIPIFNSVTCNGFDVQFTHNSTNANTVFWDFGDASNPGDTSNLNSPTYHYPAAGIYFVKLVINRGTGCSDSVTKPLGVFPGFVPDFSSQGSCFTSPYQFTDNSTTVYGNIDSWRWNFGDAGNPGDTSQLQNPQWTYGSPGVKTVTLIVSNSKGCIDTVAKTITVLDKPPISVAFPDTLICSPASVTLQAIGVGNFSWTPNINIINANTASPTVSPTTDTWYVVHMDNAGCTNDDSVHVRVAQGVNLAVRNDTTICLTDAVQLFAVSNAVTYQWTPAATLDNPSVISPMATPVDPVTTYQLTAFIGNCFAVRSVTIRTVPYPYANAGGNMEICYNTSAQLNAQITGNRFFWTPTKYLSDSTILNPVAWPPRTTKYVLTVFDNVGCPKAGLDSIIITVDKKIRAYAGHDTAVVVGQPLYLQASGGTQYHWIPSYDLSDPNIADPVGVYGLDVDTIHYSVVVTDNAGCIDTAHVSVTVFKTYPDIFVPTAFTPNGDGKNDVIRPIPVGILKINYFSVYNRWGELVFTTTEYMKGWDGRIGGTAQDSGVFVWIASGIDYKGRPVFRKGTVALIR